MNCLFVCFFGLEKFCVTLAAVLFVLVFYFLFCVDACVCVCFLFSFFLLMFCLKVVVNFSFFSYVFLVSTFCDTYSFQGACVVIINECCVCVYFFCLHLFIFFIGFGCILFWYVSIRKSTIYKTAIFCFFVLLFRYWFCSKQVSSIKLQCHKICCWMETSQFCFCFCFCFCF